ncbi:ester cyclase [Maribellus maritimus]|uniref:ester cyclase n=1 Tax=Maribellus maritimus TaxID=2870838 RepID=UPI001EEA93DF|nr:nuclear transport factor 2 family protein [Maribellus maritimus]MCG6190969.1 nuclear transport factor 2 family protein [Maribellus maritimus]
MSRCFLKTQGYEEVCSGRFSQGKTAIKNYIVATIEGMPDSKFEIVSIVANENQAVVEWVWEGTNSVGWPQMSIPATNKTMSLKGISIMQIENAKISMNKDYWDWNSLMKGIGIK